MSHRYRRFVLPIVLVVILNLLGSRTPTYAQTSTGLKLVKVEALTNYLADNTSGVRDAVLSPDGKTILAASLDKGLCLYDLSGKPPACTPWPDNFKGIPVLSWSPNSKYVAFTEDVFHLLQAGHLWLF